MPRSARLPALRRGSALPTYRPSSSSAKSQLPSARQAAHNGTMSRRVPRTRAYAPDPAAPGRPLRHARLRGARANTARPKSRTQPERLLVVLPGACARLQRRPGTTTRACRPGEIEAQLRADTAWQRPSWPLGRLGSAAAWDEELLRDPLHLLAAGRVQAQASASVAAPPPRAARAAGHAWACPGRPRWTR